MFTGAGFGMIDANTNGLSDVWENLYSLSAATANADPDGDGLSNLQEAMAGTNPKDSNSFFRLRSTLIPSAALLRWPSRVGKRYQMEASESLGFGDWQPQGIVVEGTGVEVLGVVPQQAQSSVVCRLRVLTGNAVRPEFQLPYATDADGDSYNDYEEFVAGTDPFDSNSNLRISQVVFGKALQLTWPGVPGKYYIIESATNGLPPVWRQESGMLTGVEGEMGANVAAPIQGQLFRVRVADGDSDGDGVTDWEERVSGRSEGAFHYRTNFPTLAAAVSAQLAATNVVTLEVLRATANSTRDLPAIMRVVRTGNLAALTVHYSTSGDAVPGTDYVALSGTVALPAGAKSADFFIVPNASVSDALVRSVRVELQAGVGYAVASNSVGDINIVREVAVSVRDFGATGDGVTDDTGSLQAAINALETANDFNTLYFPSGTYRLNVATNDGNPSWSRLLKLGDGELSGRDLFFTGAPGATLYSTVHDLRADMIMVRARFRSLTFRGLNWAKEPIALPETQYEPNGAGGVLIRSDDMRQVQAVEFFDCNFDNCHPAVGAFGEGFDLRGKLARFEFVRCGVTNRYGPNTTNSWLSSGGGQQVRLNPWVRVANYLDNYFDGGDDNNPVYNPGGRCKDGSHFGSPLKLVFSNNIVRNTGAEAVHQYDDSFMAATEGNFVIPPPDGTPVQSHYLPAASTFEPGQLLTYRVWFHPNAQATNVFLRVVAADLTNRIITLTNPGMTANVVGRVVPSVNPIYLADYNPTTALIVGNLLENSARYGLCGITANAKAIIRENVIVGYEHGVLTYDNPRNPLYPPTAGLVIDSNVILTRDSGTWPYHARGIISYGPSDRLLNNLILTPRSFRFVGIACRDSNSWVEGNTVIAGSITHNSYASNVRAVGIAFGYGTTNGVAAANRTCGMDVGVGPEGSYQVNPHRVIQHLSRDDVLAIDPIGLLP